MATMSKSELNKIRGIENTPKQMTKTEIDAYRQKVQTTTVPLSTNDGQTFGDVSYNAYKAIESNMIDAYTPINDNESQTIVKYKDYLNNVLTDLVMADGSTLGKITKGGLDAIGNYTLNSYVPKSDVEKGTIEKYKQVSNYIEPTEKVQGDNVGSNIQHTGDQFGWSFSGALKGMGNFLRDMFAMQMEQTKYDPVMHIAESQGWIEEGYNAGYGEIIDKQNEAIFADIKKSGEVHAKQGALIDLKYPDLSDASRTVGKLVGGTGQIIPMIAVSAINPTLGTMVFGSQVYGGSLSEALADGATIDQARAYSGMEAVKEMAIERVFGGLPFTKGFADDLIKPFTNKVFSNAIVKTVGKKAIDVLGEGFEEVVAEIITPYIKRAVYDKSAPTATMGDLSYAFAGGAVAALLLGVPGDVSTGVQRLSLGDKITTYNKSLELIPQSIRPEQLNKKTTTIEQYNTAVTNLLTSSKISQNKAEKEAALSAIKFFNTEIENVKNANTSASEKKSLINGYTTQIKAFTDYTNDLELQRKDLSLIKDGRADVDLIEKYNALPLTFNELQPTHIDFAVGVNSKNGFVNIREIADNRYLVTNVNGETVIKYPNEIKQRYSQIQDNDFAQKALNNILNSEDMISTTKQTIPAPVTDIDTTTSSINTPVAQLGTQIPAQAEKIAPTAIVNTPPVNEPITGEFDEIMATDISDVKAGDVYVAKDTGNKITVVNETDKSVKIEVNNGNTTSVRDISVNQAEKLKGDNFEKQPIITNDTAVSQSTNSFYNNYHSEKQTTGADILFAKMGDFYEAFDNDAQTLSDELELTITGRDVGLAQRAKMVGIPAHSLDAYIKKLGNHTVETYTKDGIEYVALKKQSDTAMPKQVPTGEVITLSKPANKKGYSLNNKQFNLFKNAHKIIVGSDLVGDGYFIIPKTDDVMNDIKTIEGANIAEKENLSFATVSNVSNSLSLSGDPKIQEVVVDEYIDGVATGKKITQKSYLFKINDKFYGVQQKYLDAFNNGENTFWVNDLVTTRPILVKNANGEVTAIIMPIRADNADGKYDTLPYASAQIAETSVAAQAKKAELAARPIDNKILKEFLSMYNNIPYYVTENGNLFLTNGYFMMLSDKNTLDYIAQKTNEKNETDKAPVISERLREYIETPNANYEFTQNPFADAQMYIFTDGDKYFGYNKRYVDIFNKDGNRFFVDNTADNSNLIIKNNANEIVGVILPIKLAEDTSDKLKDKSPIEGNFYSNATKQTSPTSKLNVVVDNSKTDLKNIADDAIIENNKSQAIADFVKSKLEKGEKISSNELFVQATRTFGDTMANNAFTSKDAYDAMELGVNQFILAQNNLSPESMLGILELLPTQTKRTEGMDKFQQFSTPPSIAYLANWVANVNKNDVMLEPSAGIGGIALFAKKDGATVYVNELDPRRLEVLKNMPFDGFYNEDAEQINNILGGKLEPTVIVMNPPFSSSSERNIHNTKIGAKHIEEALKTLAPNGRLVAIVGQGMSDNAPAFRDWWKKIKSEYNVIANIGIDGKNYNKYGTNFGIQMLVIDKNGTTTLPTKVEFVQNIADLQEMLRGIRDVRPSIQIKNDTGNEQKAVTTTRPETLATGRNDRHRPLSNIVSDADSTADTKLSGDRKGQKSTSAVNRVVGKPVIQAPTTSNDVVTGDPNISTGTGDNGRIEGNSELGKRGNDRNDVGSDGTERNGTTPMRQSTGVTGERRKVSKLTDNIFEQYEPQNLLLENAQKHPANISESAAMSAIELPPVNYKPNLSQSIIDNGTLSDVQLEAVTYAGQSHKQTLPNKNARGFFLGDGTGVGKGRTITGIILDNYNQGRKKALWISENKGLLPDAKRDVKALFGSPDLVKDFEGGKKADKSLSSNDGILFSTYSTLSRGFDNKGSTFEKIVNWLGKDFDGVIVFDEAHNMANSKAEKGTRGVKKASQKGLAGIALQEALPKAKVVYSSATGATEVSNLRYLDRLGLWGEGTAFPTGDDFVSKIKSGGLAAMELIARDMKAMGVYLSRNISYEDVIYDKIVHKLTSEQRKVYDELARSWQIVFGDIEKALETTNQNKDGMAKGKAYGAFWSAEQRFFNQILTAMQVPSMITDIQKQLDDGNSAVIQLVSTNEAAQEKEFARLQEEELELDDFDLTPKQMLMSYIENSFPIVQFEEYKDEKGNVKSRRVYDSKGIAVINRDAVKQRDELLNKLGSIKVPASPLDMIINHFGSDMVAENTGRKRRVVNKNGKMVEENIANKKEADVTSFQNGDKRIIVFSKAGGTGKSYHADRSAKNQQHRVHYLLQAGWQADSAVQGFGRSHRSNQVSAPTFKLITTDLKGQMRFISTIAKRLDQLGALTKGQRQTGSQGMFSASDNLENSFAADVLSLFYKDLVKNKVSGVTDGMDIIKKLGLKSKIIDDYGQIITTAPELREVNKFLNRILSLESNEQNAVFDGYSERLQNATEKAMQEGSLDKGLENYKADKITLNEVKDIREDESTKAKTKYYNLTVQNKVKPIKFDDINTSNDSFVGFYQNKSTGNVRAVFKTSSMTDQYGNVYDNYRLVGQVKPEYIPQNRFVNGWDKLQTDDAKKLWNDEVSNLPEFSKENLHLISGVVLPVWDKLPTENVRIYRVLTDKGEMLIGRVIPENMIDETLRRLGSNRTKEKINTTDLISGIKKGDIVYLDNGWKINQRKVSNENRIEITGPDYAHYELLKNKGIFTERINSNTRYFIPVESNTVKILDDVLKISPVLRVENKNISYLLESEGNVNEQNKSRQNTLDNNRDKRSVTASNTRRIGKIDKEAGKSPSTAHERRAYTKGLAVVDTREQLDKHSIHYNKIPSKLFNDEMREIQSYNEKHGIETIFTSGTLKIENKYTAKGLKYWNKIYIQYDNDLAPDVINKHEISHLQEGTPVFEVAKNKITSTLGNKKLLQILKSDYTKYFRAYDNDMQRVVNEFICDVLSGNTYFSNLFEYETDKYWNSYNNEPSSVGFDPATYSGEIDVGGTIDNIGFGGIFSTNETYNDNNTYSLEQKTANFSKNKLDILFEAYSVKPQSTHKDYAQRYVTFISPTDFLDLTSYRWDVDTPDQHITGFVKTIEQKSREKYGKLDNEILADDYTAPFLMVDMATGEVTGHEGRHRISLLRDAGINRVAIQIVPDKSEQGKYERKKIGKLTLTGQEFSLGKTGAEVELKNITPLSNRYRDDVYKQFGSDTNVDIRYSLDNDVDELTPERIKEIKDQFEKDRVGVQKQSPKDVWGERWQWVAHNISRVFPDIPERDEAGTFFAEFRKMMVQWNALPKTASFMTQDKLNKMTEELTPKEFRTFSELVYFLDLQEEAKMQVERGYDEILLPNEITPKEVDEIIKVLNTEATPKVMNALQKRQYLWKDLKEKYVSLNQLIGFDTENRFIRENYYRHQVIDYMTNNKDVGTGGRKVEIKAGRGWLKQRQGSTKAINTDFLAVEYQAMLQMQYDSYIANTWVKVGEQYDIKAQLEKKAFQSNKQLLDDIITTEAKANGKDGEPAMIMRNGRLVPDSASYEQQQWYNKRIMFGFSGLYDLAERNDLSSFDGEYKNVVDTLKNKNLNGVSQSVLYKYIGVLAGLNLDENATDGEKQAVMNARTILKYTSQKKAWIKDTLSNNYQTWETLAKEKSDSYGIIQPRRGNYFYTKNIIDEDAFSQSVNQMVTNMIDGQGIEMTDDVKKLFEQYSDTVRLTGAAYQQMVLPNEIIKTMELVGNPKQASEGVKAFRGVTTAWKGWATSVNPLRTVKFGIRNFAGDLDAVIAGKPQIIPYAKRAMGEIYDAMRHKKYSPEFWEWTERGGYSSMIFANEMDTEMQDKLFAHLKEKTGKSIFSIPGKVIEGYMNGVENAHNFREAILRYSAYLYFKDSIAKNGGKVADNVASNRYIVKGLKSAEDKAYQLSKDLLGAYDEVNKMGQTLRRYWIPFYSFTETNLKRYYRLFENIIMSDDKIPKKVGKLLLKALMVNLLSLLIIAWNKFVKPEDDEKLPPSVRVRPHITLGSIDANVYAFTRLGSFTELLEWVGLDDYTFESEDIKAPLNKVWGMITPFTKMPIELASGLNFYPELTKPRAIKDKAEHFFNSLGVADIYNQIAGKPTRGIGNTIENAFIYKYDYEESAYYEVADRKREFQNRGDSNTIYGVDDKSNALYYMKLAVKYNDKKAALKYLDEYFNNGGTGKGITQSFATLNPMYGFTGKGTLEKGQQFVKSLDDNEKSKLKIAQKYYDSELMLPDNVTELLKKKDITNPEAKNVLTKYINAKIKD